MARNYYCLIAGLKEFNSGTEHKGFDAVALRAEISEALHPDDRLFLRYFYTFYDILNVLAGWYGKSSFNALGNLSREEIAEELSAPSLLPEELGKILRDHITARSGIVDPERSTDTSLSLEKNLWSCFYEGAEKSSNSFIRKWYSFDRESRNISAAYIAREKQLDIEAEMVGRNDTTFCLIHSPAADFGLRGDIDYMERLIQALDTENIVEKERLVDRLRWDKAEELAVFDYFNLNAVLSYCARINIIHRWLALDSNTGEEFFRKLIADLSGREVFEKALADGNSSI